MSYQKKILVLALTFLPTVSMAASNLSSEFTMPLNQNDVLMTFSFQKNKDASPYYRLKYNSVVSGQNGNDCESRSLTEAVYSNYFNKRYVVDKNSRCDVGSDIRAVQANFSLESCDVTFKDCHLIGNYPLKVEFKGSKITAIKPNKIEATLE